MKTRLTLSCCVYNVCYYSVWRRFRTILATVLHAAISPGCKQAETKSRCVLEERENAITYRATRVSIFDVRHNRREIHTCVDNCSAYFVLRCQNFPGNLCTLINFNLIL